MKCPECGRICWRDEVDVGVGFICSDWTCECGWDEGQSYPLDEFDWIDFIDDHSKSIDNLMERS